jgi:hypothetical protein
MGCGRLRDVLSQFYEFGIAIPIRREIELDIAAQCASETAAAQCALQAVGIGGARLRAAAEIRAAAGQHAAGIDHRARHASRVAVAIDGDAHELGLRRDARAAYAAAPGHVARYGACPPALSDAPAPSPVAAGSAASGGVDSAACSATAAVCGSSVDEGSSTGTPSPF